MAIPHLHHDHDPPRHDDRAHHHHPSRLMPKPRPRFVRMTVPVHTTTATRYTTTHHAPSSTRAHCPACTTTVCARRPGPTLNAQIRREVERR